MAYKRKRIYGRRKRVVRRRFRKYAGTLSLYRRRANKYLYRRLRMPIGMFSPTKTVMLRYVESFTLNPGTDSVSTYVFRAGSLYDPNYTSTGHQPMYFDTYASIYSYYRVRMATISFVAIDNKVVNTAVNNQVSGTTTTTSQYYAANERGCRMFIIRDVEVNDYPTMLNTLIEEGNRNLKWKYAPQNTSSGMHKLRMRCWPHKQHNLSYNDDALGSPVTDNPSAATYFICGVDSMPGTNADSMTYQVIITYKATFFDLKKNQTEN